MLLKEVYVAVYLWVLGLGLTPNTQFLTQHPKIKADFNASLTFSVFLDASMVVTNIRSPWHVFKALVGSTTLIRRHGALSMVL